MVENPLSQLVSRAFKIAPVVAPVCDQGEGYLLMYLASSYVNHHTIPVETVTVARATAHIIRKNYLQTRQTSFVLDCENPRLQGVLLFGKQPLRGVYARARYDLGGKRIWQADLNKTLESAGLPAPGDNQTTLDLLMKLLNRLGLPVGTNFVSSIQMYSSWLEASGIAQANWGPR